jgi:hypothetical protein
MHLDESSDDLLGTVLESSDLPIFLFHSLPSVAVVPGCAAGRRKRGDGSRGERHGGIDLGEARML